MNKEGGGRGEKDCAGHYAYEKRSVGRPVSTSHVAVRDPDRG